MARKLFSHLYCRIHCFVNTAEACMKQKPCSSNKNAFQSENIILTKHGLFIIACEIYTRD